jgi:hypothetical protein
MYFSFFKVIVRVKFNLIKDYFTKVVHNNFRCIGNYISMIEIALHYPF